MKTINMRSKLHEKVQYISEYITECYCIPDKKNIRTEFNKHYKCQILKIPITFNSY